MVIGLGGNALQSPEGSQDIRSEFKNAAKAARQIANIVKAGRYNIVITHGNGTQVGLELIKNERSEGLVPKLPLFVLNAETQASIGTVLELALRNEFKRLRINREINVLVTHVVVDGKDPAFSKPTKPVGPLYSKEKLFTELKKGRFDYVRVGGRYRRVVPSPWPLRILEADAVSTLVKKSVVIAAGGGGIPVVREKGGYAGVDAVIDKDRTTQILATSLRAERMIILTDVDYVYGNAKRTAPPILYMKAGELRNRLDVFEEGTMRPKLEACVKFIEHGGREARIGNLFKLKEVMKGRSGTRIT